MNQKARVCAKVCLTLAVLYSLAGPLAAQEEPRKVVVRKMPEHIKEEFVVGKIKSVSSPTVNDLLLHNTGIVSRKQLVELEITEGPLKGQTFSVPNELTDNPSFNVNVQPGREVVLSVVSERGRSPEVNIADYNRTPVLVALAVVFLASFIAFGGKTGLKSLLGLVAAIGLIGFVLLPLSLQGYDPLLTSTGICTCAAMATILAVGGLSRKSLAAFAGTICGVVIAGTAAHLVIVSAPLTGLASEEAQILRGSVLAQPPVFFAGLLAASMLIGALGVIMDVAISVASAVRELSVADPTLTAKDLYWRGMNVGRDIMGSMTTTLVLAYAGGALPLLLLMAREPSIKFLNLDLVATEVASALTGSLGLVWTIPATAFVASKLMAGFGSGRGPRRKDVFEEFPVAKSSTDTDNKRVRTAVAQQRRPVPPRVCTDRSGAR